MPRSKKTSGGKKGGGGDGSRPGSAASGGKSSPNPPKQAEKPPVVQNVPNVQGTPIKAPEEDKNGLDSIQISAKMEEEVGKARTSPQPPLPQEILGFPEVKVEAPGAPIKNEEILPLFLMEDIPKFDLLAQKAAEESKNIIEQAKTEISVQRGGEKPKEEEKKPEIKAEEVKLPEKVAPKIQQEIPKPDIKTPEIKKGDSPPKVAQEKVKPEPKKAPTPPKSPKQQAKGGGKSRQKSGEVKSESKGTDKPQQESDNAKSDVKFPEKPQEQPKIEKPEVKASEKLPPEPVKVAPEVKAQGKPQSPPQSPKQGTENVQKQPDIVKFGAKTQEKPQQGPKNGKAEVKVPEKPPQEQPKIKSENKTIEKPQEKQDVIKSVAKESENLKSEIKAPDMPKEPLILHTKTELEVKNPGEQAQKSPENVLSEIFPKKEEEKQSPMPENKVPWRKDKKFNERALKNDQKLKQEEKSKIDLEDKSQTQDKPAQLSQSPPIQIPKAPEVVKPEHKVEPDIQKPEEKVNKLPTQSEMKKPEEIPKSDISVKPTVQKPQDVKQGKQSKEAKKSPEPPPKPVQGAKETPKAAEAKAEPKGQSEVKIPTASPAHLEKSIEKTPPEIKKEAPKTSEKVTEKLILQDSKIVIKEPDVKKLDAKVPPPCQEKIRTQEAKVETKVPPKEPEVKVDPKVSPKAAEVKIEPKSSVKLDPKIPAKEPEIKIEAKVPPKAAEVKIESKSPVKSDPKIPAKEPEVKVEVKVPPKAAEVKIEPKITPKAAEVKVETSPKKLESEVKQIKPDGKKPKVPEKPEHLKKEMEAKKGKDKKGNNKGSSKAPEEPKSPPPKDASKPVEKGKESQKATEKASKGKPHVKFVEEPKSQSKEAPEAPKGKPTKLPSCPVCQKPANFRCSACFGVSYCSKDHQKQHWKSHKGSCTAWKVSESPLLGRYLTAVRDIKAGDLIMEESPLLLTPPRITRPLCLLCYEEFGENSKIVRCPLGCGWPICSSCSKSKDIERSSHGRSECKYSKARGGVDIKNMDSDHPLYQSIGLLRALSLKEDSPRDWAVFADLQSHAEERRKRALKEVEEQEKDQGIEKGSHKVIPSPEGTDAQQLEMNIQLVQKFFKLEDRVDRDWIEMVSGIIETNGHEIPVGVPEIGKETTKRLVGIYRSASLLEHNCTPNCLKNFKLSPTVKDIQIRSARAIKKGDHISICYVDPLWGTNDRTNFLSLTKFFVCKCVRCCSSNELGTHISSLVCAQCESNAKDPKKKKHLMRAKDQGYITPEDPFNPSSEWKCNECGETYSPNYPTCILEKIGRELEGFGEKRGRIYGEEDFLQRYGKLLHPNHFFMLEMKVELAQLYGRTPEEPLPSMSIQKIMRKIELCEEILEVTSIILPGYSRLRSIILYELQASTISKSKFEWDTKQISSAEYKERIEKCLIWLKEAIKIMSWEPEMSVERRRAEGAKREYILLKEELVKIAKMEVQEPKKPPPVSLPATDYDEFDGIDMELF